MVTDLVTTAPSPTANLLAPLVERLPGVAQALDLDHTAGQIERWLLHDGRTIADIAPAKLWLRADESFGLRYHLRLSGPSDDRDELVVLGRVHASAGESGVTLSRFPDHPDLPTLPWAVDPTCLRRLSVFVPRTEVDVVHHPREGACVLRYRTASLTLYGKVYPDGHGGRVERRLRALAETAGSRTAFPASLGYLPDLRVLVTQELPGEPVVPTLVKRVYAAGSGAASGESGALTGAVRESGRALAALHGGDVTNALARDLATTPVRSASRELSSVRREVELVRRVWPHVAARVAGRIDVLCADLPRPVEPVLSHGDFTPSQVLLTGRGSAMVDADTLCWADPALDVGRYLAHLDLLRTKTARCWPGVDTDGLTNDFVDGYVEVRDGRAVDAIDPDRLVFFRSTTLARAALNSCRQLKGRRLDLAMSLLDDVLTEGCSQ